MNKYFSILLICLGYLVNSQTLSFSYDAAGNQIERCYNCNTNKQTNDGESTQFASYFYVFPNPTKGRVQLRWDEKVRGLIHNISILGLNSNYRENLVFNKNLKEISLDLSSQPMGYYIVLFELSNGIVVDKKIIKN